MNKRVSIPIRKPRIEMTSSAQAVFSNPDLRAFILEKSTQLSKMKYCSIIYKKWDVQDKEKFICTLPHGNTHHKHTKKVKWSLRMQNPESCTDESPLIISDWVSCDKRRRTGVPKASKGIYYDWVMDDTHLRMKEKMWYIPKYERSDADDFDLRIFREMTRQFRSTHRVSLLIQVEDELRARGTIV